MKIYQISLILFSFCFLSCKTEPKKENIASEPERSIPEKIAYAHGIEHWNSVNKIEFTFNVDRDTTHFQRTWMWDVRNNEVTRIMGADTTVYDRAVIDSITAKVDAGFINDKYWLLAPFNLKWDQNSYTYEHSTSQISPISKTPMQKLTIVYGNTGGYTPGDAYDFYFEDDYLLKEWVFRKGNQKDISLATTWEDYETISELQIGKRHKNEDGSFALYFTEISAN